MSLQRATIKQLVEWQQAIIAELARRASSIPTVQPIVPPWEGLAEAHAVEQLAAPERKFVAPAVYATARTDMDLAAKFASMPARPEQAPPVKGNGQGDGQVEFGL